ncbi:hypothetical protein CH296_00360 [Rhodococcus sp. 14-2496-1d]|uniref:Gp37-like protein n=1 Tax=Rhodococcus sp. 14-2496-1d TaxID=2023146 RepID=UPI000B9B1953|nr:hypothetical protein [Rhodococcus sp. 14-2496-1d]OZF40744.1 hypothetical protein CH296_00360 [Rhodococcus sp. 14-2496-1d]
MTIDTSASLLDQCEAIWAATEAIKEREDNLRKVPPLVRLWDGDAKLQHVVQMEYSASFELVDGDTGAIRVEHPYDHPTGRWLVDTWGRMQRGEKRNVVISCDYTGARPGGLMSDVTLELRDNGDQVVVATFTSDFEQLKWYHVWPNSFLPAAFQAPRVFILPGPLPWVLSNSLFFQVLREQSSLWAIPDDPTKLSNWFNLNQSTWGVVVKPISFIESMASGAIWGAAISRMKNWYEMAKSMLEDGEITPYVRRWFNGDPPPWPGAVVKHGALVVSFEDRSGTFTGTAAGGTMFDGLFRTFEQFASDFIDTTTQLVTDTAIPADYYIAGKKGTHKSVPYCVWRDAEETGIETYAFKQVPSKAVQVVVGGHSMPGVNEAISAGIQALGDILGNLAQIGSIGGSVDTLLRPFYEDTVLAWISVKSLARAQNSGFIRFFEFFQDGAGKAYTLASLMVLRQGFWATRSYESVEINVGDGSPFLIGDQGEGHIWLGDRGGNTIRNDPTARIYMNRLSKLTLAWDDESPWEWKTAFGDDRALQDPLQRAWERIEAYASGLQQAGVF